MRATLLAATLLVAEMAATACAESNFAGEQESPKSSRKDKDKDDDKNGHSEDAKGVDQELGIDPALGTPATVVDSSGGGLGNTVDAGANQPPAISLDSDNLNCNRGKQGLTGKLFQLPQGTGALPNFATMTPQGQVEALTLDVPARDWEDGFPGVPGLREWFAIQFFALLEVPADGTYSFKTNSDDGSKVYIDDALQVNNDGQHAPTMSAAAQVALTKGKHRIVVEWYQGPKKQIALQVYWQQPGLDWAIIPAEALTTATDCNLQIVGRFP